MRSVVLSARATVCVENRSLATPSGSRRCARGREARHAYEWSSCVSFGRSWSPAFLHQARIHLGYKKATPPLVPAGASQTPVTDRVPCPDCARRCFDPGCEEECRYDARPPLASYTAPVEKLGPFDDSQAISSATSSGRSIRPIGARLRERARIVSATRKMITPNSGRVSRVLSWDGQAGPGLCADSGVSEMSEKVHVAIGRCPARAARALVVLREVDQATRPSPDEAHCVGIGFDVDESRCEPAPPSVARPHHALDRRDPQSHSRACEGGRRVSGVLEVIGREDNLTPVMGRNEHGCCEDTSAPACR